MNAPPDPDPARRAFDAAAAARGLRRMARQATPPWLPGEVARRMAARLPMILRQPETIVQWWGWLGASDALLAAAYPRARRWLVEPTPALLRRSATATRAPWWAAWRRGASAASVVAEADVPAGGTQLLWSNMMLHLGADPTALLARWKRVLGDDGFVMFSTYGPGTLVELRALYGERQWPSPAAPFVDMHDLGDMLVHAGFADPVMDQECLRLGWTDADALVDELSTLGANADPLRHPGLRTPRWRRRLLQALEERRGADGRITLSFEIVYGHAFNAPPRVPVTARTELAPEALRAMARRGRPASR